MFANDATVVELIRADDKTLYRAVGELLVRWFGDKNIFLNGAKTKKLIFLLVFLSKTIATCSLTPPFLPYFTEAYIRAS